ncbi:MAG TPA: hypothetical protein VMF62_10725 [Acetobacteraceae bacterium]|nr:hypothetical protein [Acetobacteraceae bacterium]
MSNPTPQPEELPAFAEIDRLLEGGAFPDAVAGDDPAVTPDPRVFFDDRNAPTRTGSPAKHRESR